MKDKQFELQGSDWQQQMIQEYFNCKQKPIEEVYKEMMELYKNDPRIENITDGGRLPFPIKEELGNITLNDFEKHQYSMSCDPYEDAPGKEGTSFGVKLNREWFDKPKKLKVTSRVQYKWWEQLLKIITLGWYKPTQFWYNVEEIDEQNNH